MYYFPDFNELSLWVFFSSSNFLNTALWILYQKNCTSPCLWIQLLENFLWSFCGVYFLGFSSFLGVLCYGVHIWSSSHPLQSLLIPIRVEIPSNVPLETLQNSQTFHEPAPSFLLTFVAEFFSMYAFIDPIMHQVECWQPFSCFPKSGTKAQVCGLWTTDSVCFLYILMSSVPKLALATTLKSMHSKPATVWGGGVGEAHKALRMSMGLWGNLEWGAFPEVNGWASWYSLLHSRLCVYLMPPKNSTCHFPKLFPPLNHGTPNLGLWIWQDRNEPLWQHLRSWKSWMLTFMLSLALREKSWV